ncbi:unnamed protein product, partial [Meganyctiphanes norvegica]
SRIQGGFEPAACGARAIVITMRGCGCWCIRKWRLYISYTANITIFVFIMLILGAGFYVIRKSLKADVSNLNYILQTNSEVDILKNIPKYFFENNKINDADTIATVQSLQTYEINDYEENTGTSFNNDNTKLALNIPNEIYETEKYSMDNGDHCHTLPSITDLIFDKIYWQKYTFSNGKSLYMYSAYYDHREMFGKTSFVRINGLMNTKTKTKSFMCKLWFKIGNKKVEFSSIALNEIFHRRPRKATWGTIIATCEIPPEKYGEVPFAVSIVERKYEKPTNLLRVDYLQPKNNIKKKFAVCVKGLDFPSYDISIQLVEWFELLFILGVDKVYLYKFNLHPNISKVFEYYRNNDKLEVMPVNLPGDQPSDPQHVHKFIVSDVKEKNRQ